MRVVRIPEGVSLQMVPLAGGVLAKRGSSKQAGPILFTESGFYKLPIARPARVLTERRWEGTAS